MHAGGMGMRMYVRGGGGGEGRGGRVGGGAGERGRGEYEYRWGSGEERAGLILQAEPCTYPGLGLGFGLAGLASGKWCIGTWPVTRLDLRQNRLQGRVACGTR